ncbi:phosphatidylserine/phosphatidylglycerophosphate/cardiolipin synthase family protein [Halanaerobiaceae bacterium Z-7014]|uniref:Phosphatidylserine/phosphatidylglycerophosphate/ cardiolipin synthase family protein n=1 Tax=Halonatronomonas betaini TaxID=2778430 RepID=A0A931F7J8_9FIRM|nr:phosphatidylserine/phosphatidylglycerophosphate/cardiolipin synthase family protein [Halonatronomonas betaini]MBF8435568.1 phosphatidylserine/phosphatidylglycerophosphate/cardiolipin synthase family protein [Halonatronomonas betaini]
MKINKIMKKLILAYIIYFLLAGIIVFGFLPVPGVESAMDYSLDESISVSNGQDEALLLEGLEIGKLARVNLIENAEESLDIAYYMVHKGDAADIFYGQILDAADRGIKVRLIIDGIYSAQPQNRSYIYAMTSHENIKFKTYEPINPLRPWAVQNRLHDKIVIADGNYALISGRNIGDKYFDPDIETPSIDRDVLLVNEEPGADSVLTQFDDYYDKLWESEFNKNYSDLNSARERLARRRVEEINNSHQELQDKYSELFGQDLDWQNYSYPTDQVMLVHNPLERFNKQPRVWQVLAGLFEEAEDSIMAQSPYIIPTDQMLKFLDQEEITAGKINLLTNSLTNSSNPLAGSGYSLFQDDLKDFIGDRGKLYEYYNNGAIHAKSYVIDERISAIGSFNLDHRSAFLSTETMVIIESEPFAENFLSQVDGLIEQSYPYQEAPEEEVSTAKEISLRGLSYFSRFFKFML